MNGLFEGGHCDGNTAALCNQKFFERAQRLSLLALGQNSEAVHGPDKLTDRSPQLQPAEPRSEASKRRKEFINSPTNPCQCFCVMDAPEIYQSAGLVVAGEFLTAVQASDVGSPATDSLVSE